METILDSIFNEAVILITLGAVGGFGAWLKKIKNTQDESCKRLWRVEKALTLFVKLELEQTKRDHPETNVREIELIINEILNDD